MLKNALLTFSELAIWLALMAVLLGGCAKPPAETDGSEHSTHATDPSFMTDIPLIPRDVLFGNPDKMQARLSPDGRYLSYSAPVDGVINVFVGPVDDISQAKQVTDDRIRGVRSYSWAYNSRYIIYRQDEAGSEDWHIYATDVQTGETRDLTPVEGVNARMFNVSDRFPDEVLIGLNDRDPRYHDIWRVNIVTGAREMLQENPGFDAIITDDDYQVRMSLFFTEGGGMKWQVPEGSGEDQTWADFMTFEYEDAGNSSPAGFDKTGRIFYFEDSRNRDTAGLFAMNLDTGEVNLVAEDPRADVGGIIAHPTEKNIQAVSFTYARREWQILDDAIVADFEFLNNVEDGEMIITSRTLDDAQWTVAYVLDDGPVKFYRYERTPDRKMHYLFSSQDELNNYPLVKMHSPIITSRDGLALVSYLTLPPGSDPDGDGRPNQPLPMVLDVHGGPWSRDGWGFNSTHQWLANRGYAVLSVNFRGSTGFGKNFANAAIREWAGKMHDDLLDAVDWAVAEGIAQRERVAIMGGSYGGYATLVGLTFTPDVFACGVDTVGPSSLVTLLRNVPPYWMPFMPVLKLRVGDVDTEEGRAELLKISPLTYVDRIKKPLLIGQGANDPRVTQVEADQIVAAMAAKNIAVTYVLFPDEGHGFARPENRMSFNAVVEAFLAENLGGRFESVGEDFDGSTILVPAGSDEVPGLAEALAATGEDRTTAPPPPENKEPQPVPPSQPDPSHISE